MPVSGQEIVRRITEFAANFSRQEKDARAAAEKTSTDMDRIINDQSSAFQELARLYLPRLDDSVEQEGWSEMQAALQLILLRKADARRQLQARQEEAVGERTSAESAFQQLNDQVHELTARCDQMAKSLAGQLAENQDFQSLSRRAAENQAKLEQAQANLSEVEHEAKQKLPAYHNSSLFLYLQKRQFGTEHYSSRGLTRRLDRWISRLIDYPRAAMGFRFLTTAPGQMRQLIAEQEKLVRSLVAEVEQRQSAAAHAIGLPQAQADGSRCRAQLESAASRAERSRIAEESVRKELTDLDSPDCPYYREALAAFQALLQRTERSIVAARAAQTPELTDDQVVARVRHLDEQISLKKQAMEQFVREAESAAKKTSGILDLASRSRRAQFDHPRRVFEDNFDLDHYLNALVDGTTSVDSVYQEMYRRQKLDSPVANQAAAALEGPMAQILLQTMANAAGAALGAYAARAGQQHRLPKQKDWF